MSPIRPGLRLSRAGSTSHSPSTCTEAERQVPRDWQRTQGCASWPGLGIGREFSKNGNPTMEVGTSVPLLQSSQGNFSKHTQPCCPLLEIILQAPLPALRIEQIYLNRSPAVIESLLISAFPLSTFYSWALWTWWSWHIERAESSPKSQVSLYPIQRDWNLQNRKLKTP